MPVVRAYVAPSFKERLDSLQLACEEIVPAGMNSEDGPLTPGSIEFIVHVVESGLKTDVFIDIEADYHEDRFRATTLSFEEGPTPLPSLGIDDRAELMKDAFNAIFPEEYTFAVYAKLMKAGWSSDVDDDEFTGDMSMEAALERYWERKPDLDAAPFED